MNEHEAEAAGHEAHASGKPRVVPLGIVAWHGKPGDTNLDAARSWYKGWDASNLSAPWD